MSRWIDPLAHLDPDAVLSPKRIAARIDWVSERALRDAVSEGRVRSTPGRRTGVRVLRVGDLVEDLRTLPPCSAPVCDFPALASSGSCGQRGHRAAGRTRPAAVGQKISAAKKGLRQLQLEPGEITLTEAVRETGLSYRALRDGADADKLRHRTVPRPGGQAPVVIFDRDELEEDLAACLCSYPPCDNPAPGKSGRCGDHAAHVKDVTVDLVCQHEACGRRFTRPGSWLRERDGRGHFCSNECKGAAFDAANPGRLQKLNPDGARVYHRAIADAIRAEHLVDTASAVEVTGLAPSTVRAASQDAGGDLRLFGGSSRLVYSPAELARWHHCAHGTTAAFGRLASILAEQHGGAVGRPRALPAEVESRVLELREAGTSIRAIARIVSAPKGQVERLLARDKLSRNPS